MNKAHAKHIETIGADTITQNHAIKIAVMTFGIN